MRWPVPMLALVLLVTGGAASAQEAAPERSSSEPLVRVFTARALEVRLGGKVNYLGFFRNSQLLGINGGALATGGGTHSEWAVAPEVRIDLDANFTDRIDGHIQLGNRKYNSHSNPLRPAAGSLDNFGSSTRSVDVLRSYLTFQQFLLGPTFDLTLGVQPYTIDLRGDGQAFFIDVEESEDAFLGANMNIATAATATTQDGLATGGTSAFGGDSTPTRGNAADGTGPGFSSGLANSQEAAGVKGTYSVGSTKLDMFYFVLNEGRDTQADRALYGTAGWLDLGRQGKIQALATVMTNRSSTRVVSWGLGADYWLMRGDTVGVEVYGEGIMQRGYYLGHALALGGSEVRQSSWGFYGGLRYEHKVHTMKPYLDFSYWELSGDKDGTDRENGDFVSLENVDDTIIAEGDDLGLDLDTNYRKLQVKAGMAWDVFADDRIQDDLRLEALYAYLELSKNNRGRPDKIGDELDFRLTWEYSENLKFFGGTAWLLDTHTMARTGSSALHVFYLGTGFEF